jgi:amidohydrolase
MEPSAVVEDAIAWRRHLHRNPELSFHEHQTSNFVHRTLASFDGLEVERPTPTSVLARLKGPRAGRRLALRADMDALPITEESGVEFASLSDGVMHACGHDGHTAILLAVARLLAARREQLSGEVLFVFQHAEELPPGGAAELVACGALADVDAVLGCHLFSTMEVGKLAAVDGVCTAAADTFAVTVHGRGGHAAFPHETTDPVVIAAHAIVNLQQIVSRATPPADSVVLSVTHIRAGSADNVIPGTAHFGGTVRTLTDEARARTREAMQRVLDGVGSAHGATCELEYTAGYDPVINDPEMAALVRDCAGAERVTQLEPLMAGEDFSAYLKLVPGCFFWVGAGGRDAFPHHHPRFTIDERALPVAIETFTATALRYLSA